MGFGIGLEVQTFCGNAECRRVLQVNGLVESVRCPACGQTRELPEKMWRFALQDMGEVQTWVEGRTFQTGVFGRDKHLVLRRTRVDPSLGPDGFEEGRGRGWAADDEGHVAVVREVPASFAQLVPGASVLVDEDATTLTEAGVAVDLPDLKQVKGLSAACGACGAAIDLRSADRIVGCTHCRAVGFLSDEVWARLHPDRRPRRFYLWMDGEPDPQEERVHYPLDELDAHRLPLASLEPSEHAYWVGFQMVRACDACNGLMAVGAVVRSMTCPTCSASHAIEAHDWCTTIVEACRMTEEEDVEEDEEGDEEAVANFEIDQDPDNAARRAMSSTDWLSIREDPPGGLSIEESRAAVEANPGGIWNPEDDALLVRKLPPWLEPVLRPAGIELLAGELPGLVSEAWAESGPGVAGVTFSCPNCGGTLEPDGRARMIECPYCASGVGLPESVWLRLHPLRSARFWMLYDPRAGVFEFTDVYEMAGDEQGRLYVVGESEGSCEYGLFVLDRSLRLQWKALLPSKHSPRVSVGGDGGCMVWWQDEDSGIRVRELEEGGDTVREFRVEVPEDVRVHDVDPSGRVLGVRTERRRRARDRFYLVQLDEDGTVSPVWESESKSIGSWIYNTIFGPAHDGVTMLALGPRPPEIPDRASVIGGADGSIALFDDKTFVVYPPHGAEPTIKTGLAPWRDRVRRSGDGWLFPEQSGTTALRFIAANGHASTLVPADERERIGYGWPARAADGTIAIRTAMGFHLYDAEGEVTFRTRSVRDDD